MKVDAATETPSTPFHSPSSHFSLQRHFYLAIDRHQFKMKTLMDLLDVAGLRPGLPMVVCCSSHDELDAVSSPFANVPCISLASLLMVSKVVIYEAYDNLFGCRWDCNQHGRWGEVVTLNGIEESSNLAIAEMPINVSLSMLTFSHFV